MERELVQLKSDSVDAINNLGRSLSFATLALIDLLVVGGALALLLHGWLAKRNQPRQTVGKIVSDPARRAREAGGL